MTIEQLNALIAEHLGDEPSAATDEQRAALHEALSGMDDDALSAAIDSIRGETDTLRDAPPSADAVGALRVLVEARNAVTAVQAERAQEAEALATETQGLLDELASSETEGETAPIGAETDGTETAESSGETTSETATETSTETNGETEGDTVTETREPVAASARPAASGRRAGRITEHAPQNTPQRTPGSSVRTVVTAAGGNPGAEQGEVLDSTAKLGRLMSERLRTSFGAGRVGERVWVARAATEYPEERTLRANDWEGNYSKIEKVTSPRAMQDAAAQLRASNPDALVAAGGLCAPLETLYDVEVIGSTARPIRDALARFTVDRGGIQYRAAQSAAQVLAGATGTWDTTDDEANPLVDKNHYVVDCPGVQTAEIQAVYLQLEFSNITSRFDPETTAANTEQGMIAHSRLAENELLKAINAGSKTLSTTQQIGAVRDILVNLDKAIAYYRNRHRIDDRVSLTLIQPAWVRHLMRADLARQMAAGDWMEALAVADSTMDGWFTRRGVNTVWHLDGSGGGDETQTVTITGTPTGGTFTLTFNGETTGGIDFDATAAEVKTALEALPNIAPGDVSTGGGALPGTAVTVTFTGSYAGRDVSTMTADGSSLTGGTSPAVAVTETTAGGAAETVDGITVAGQTYQAATAGDALAGFPDQIDSVLFAAGTWLFLDGGVLDLGLVRDSTLNSQNRYRQFLESFEGVADRGVESLRIVQSVQPTGESAGTADTSNFTD